MKPPMLPLPVLGPDFVGKETTRDLALRYGPGEVRAADYGILPCVADDDPPFDEMFANASTSMGLTTCPPLTAERFIDAIRQLEINDDPARPLTVFLDPRQVFDAAFGIAPDTPLGDASAQMWRGHRSERHSRTRARAYLKAIPLVEALETPGLEGKPIRWMGADTYGGVRSWEFMVPGLLRWAERARRDAIRGDRRKRRERRGWR